MSTAALLSAFDVVVRAAAEHISTDALLFQAGYLTITGEERVGDVFHSYFNHGRHGSLDMAVRSDGHVYLFEFKVAEVAPPGSALAQLQVRDYAAKYRDCGEPIHLIGVEFRRQPRNIATFEVAAG